MLIVSQRGVDVGAAVFIRRATLDLAAKGSAIVMISQDQRKFLLFHIGLRCCMAGFI